VNVTLYSKKGCGLCEKAEQTIRRIQQEIDLDLKIVDIEGDAGAYGHYKDRIPVVEVEGKEVAAAPIDEARLRAALTA